MTETIILVLLGLFSVLYTANFLWNKRLQNIGGQIIDWHNILNALDAAYIHPGPPDIKKVGEAVYAQKLAEFQTYLDRRDALSSYICSVHPAKAALFIQDATDPFTEEERNTAELLLRTKVFTEC